MTGKQLDLALECMRGNLKQTIEELKTFVSIPSVSTDSNEKVAMQQATQWLETKLVSLGFDKTRIFTTEGAPVVFSEKSETIPGKPTVLVYGHYDVQPAEPLELWETMPFKPEVRGDLLFGRGTSDMKGQIAAVLAAIEAINRSGTSLPVNFKFLIEGEEEIGSPNLEKFILGHKNLLECDFALNPDAGMIGEQYPTITYGLRGLSYFEIHITGPDHDLHSGLFGGTIHNPGQVLCELIAGMHDEHGRVTLPGFYDRVRLMDKDERKELARLPMTPAFYLSQTGSTELYGEEGYTPLERVIGRPTLEVNGLLSGFTGEGSKTVLPSKAMAKISTRLVPDQDPFEVRDQLMVYLEERAPVSVHWDLELHSAGYPAITNLNHPALQAMSKALEETWGTNPLFRREGGSIPVVALLQNHLGIESVLTGFSLPEDNLHAPNERLHLPTFERGIESLIRFIDNIGS